MGSFYARTAEERLTERLEVRAAADEMADFERSAALADLKLSDWIRKRLKAAAKRELRKPDDKRRAGESNPGR